MDLNEKGNDSPHHEGHGCPGSRMMDFSEKEEEVREQGGEVPSFLRQWPVQLHLVSPLAPYFQKKDVLLAADCTAYAIGNFHREFLKGRGLAIACPKLDNGMENYKQKLIKMIDEAKINTLTVMIMEVPCCFGLVQLAMEAAEASTRKIPVKKIVVSLQGEILSEEWVGR